ncbi:unnamed protein product [Adineta steineri]|uniref:Uncharacterized protein n=1 Tax=Adineta steineri TaxID=433720 RepID=A0A814T3H9_9BILA|nr:unnamed protein product [Adineta steineri]CAF1341737.1 unnamed protein product [Adineta steineri]
MSQRHYSSSSAPTMPAYTGSQPTITGTINPQSATTHLTGNTNSTSSQLSQPYYDNARYVTHGSTYNNNTSSATTGYGATGSATTGYGTTGYGTTGYGATGSATTGYGTTGYGATGYGTTGYGTTGHGTTGSTYNYHHRRH